MFIHSLVWERMVLSLVGKLKALAPNVRDEIAARVGHYINLAKTVSDHASLARFATAAVEGPHKVLAEGVKSLVDQRWAAPALVEAWCVARLGLANGRLHRNSAMAVMIAIEAFTFKQGAITPTSWQAGERCCLSTAAKLSMSTGRAHIVSAIG